MGHFVAYRKHVSPDWHDLLPLDRLKLFGISARFPDNLAREVALNEVSAGVYDFTNPATPARLIVIRELPLTPNNAGLELFSASATQLAYARANFQRKNEELSTYINELFEAYREGGIVVADPIERYKRELKERVLSELTVEERLRGLSVEEICKVKPPEEFIRDLPIEQRVAGVSPEELQAWLDRRKSSATDPEKP